MRADTPSSCPEVSMKPPSPPLAPPWAERLPATLVPPSDQAMIRPPLPVAVVIVAGLGAGDRDVALAQLDRIARHGVVQRWQRPICRGGARTGPAVPFS